MSTEFAQACRQLPKGFDEESILVTNSPPAYT
uniref:Uncharacterized protein n=1 Tax=Nymphaea colorata TaxID=210225 RepID=A0A5K1ENG7_9MAGN